jgi:predicted metal-binding protein
MEPLEALLEGMNFTERLDSRRINPSRLTEIDVSDIAFLKDSDSWMCSDKCQEYGSHFSCSPYAPKPSETRKVADLYSKAIVALFGLDPSMPKPDLARVMQGTNYSMLDLERGLRENGYSAASAFFVYPCSLCDPCPASTYVPDTESSAFCSKPFYMRPLSETSIDVLRTAKKAGIYVRKYDRLHPKAEIDMVGILLLK